jgi:hypothetical protein
MQQRSEESDAGMVAEAVFFFNYHQEACGVLNFMH